MHSLSFSALAIALLGISSSSSTSPAISVPSSSTSSSKVPYGSSGYLHLVATLRSDNHDDVITFPDNSFEVGCSFVVRGMTYDLCPLLHLGKYTKDSTQYDKVSLKGKGKERVKERDIEIYFISMKEPKALENNPCPEWAETCFIKREGSQIMITPIQRDEHTGSSKTAVYATDFGIGGREFDLWLKSEKRDVQIVFKCAEEDEIIDHEALHGVASKETHILRWYTPLACPVEVAEGLFEAMDEDKIPAPDKESELKDGELPARGISRGWISFMSILIVSMLIIMIIVISSPQARHYLLVHLQSAGYAILPLLPNFKLVTRPFTKHIPSFRATESRLVRWAQEDIVLNEDEDFMVNGLSKGHRGLSDSQVVNEYIPLKSSSAHYANGLNGSSRAVIASWNYSTYGSMPFEALDIDESGIDMNWKQKSGVKELIKTASERVSLKFKGLLRR